MQRGVEEGRGSVKGGEKSSGEHDSEGDWIEVLHKQAYMIATLIQELRKRGAVYGGFRDRRSRKAGESGWQTTVSYQWC
jgi:hypothetical protein